MKPIGVFVQFLKGLEGENDNRRKSFRETEGKSTVEFFAILSHIGNISHGHLFQGKQGFTDSSL